MCLIHHMVKQSALLNVDFINCIKSTVRTMGTTVCPTFMIPTKEKTISFPLKSEVKRYLVVTVSFIAICVPPLRMFVNEKLEEHFKSLTKYKKCPINKQTQSKRLNEDPWNKSKFHYKGKKFKIENHNDLAKLYLQNDYMARFISVADDSCDPSAILNLMRLASCFTDEEAVKADLVRREVRNPWAHCDITKYTEGYMEKVFNHLEGLIEVLPSKESTRVV